MSYILATITLYVWDLIIFFSLIFLFLLSRYLLRSNIEKKEHNTSSSPAEKKQDWFILIGIFLVTCVYLGSLIFQVSFLQNIVTFMFSISSLYIISLVFHRKILLIYGKEVEVSGDKYFKKGYKVSVFGLFVNAFAFLIGVFLCIKIFKLDSLIEIGGLWAGILAFMGFTAPVWALDMIAGIILLQSNNFETGNVYYVYEHEMYVWIKSISLTEVKCIDLRFGNPVIFRPSQFRNFTLKNLTQGITGKSNKILREKEIFVDYTYDMELIKDICFTAHKDMMLELQTSDSANYFGDDPFISLEIDDFAAYAVKYKLFYTITSPFYIFKAERLFNSYLFKQQHTAGIYFSTPDLLNIEQNTQKKELI